MAPSPPRRKEEPSAAAKRASTAPPGPPLPEGASGATRKPAPFQRTWPPGDEVRILVALAAHRRAHGGSLPTAAELFGALDGCLQKKGVGANELKVKQRSFKRRYDRDAKKAAPPADEHERRLYFLSRDVWGLDLSPSAPTQGKGAGARASKDDAAQAKSADHQSGKEEALKHKAAKSADHRSGKEEAVKPKAKTLDEMLELYPYLVDAATILVEPAVLESLLLCIEDSNAQMLDKKIRKARKRLARTITDSARINNMEMPTISLFTSSKLQPEKLRVGNENNLLVDHLEKTDDVDLCTKQRLARMEREVVELRQAVIAYQSQAKGIRCESVRSGLQSIVAENQIPANGIEAPNGLIHGKTEEVTSKHYCAVRHNVSPNNLKRQRVPAVPVPRKVFRKSPTPCRATSRGGIC